MWTFRLPEGTYSYTAFAFGYADESSTIEVSGAARKDITLTPVEKRTVRFSVAPKDAGAAVTVQWNGKTVAAEQDGSYRLPDGTYTYTVRAKGYAKVSQTLGVSGDVTVPVVLEPSAAWDGQTVTAPEVPAGALLPHLLNGLYALSALQKPPALVKPAFEIKLLCLAGYEPLADSCAYCGRPDPEQPLLDVVQGILRCRSCGAKESALSMPLCPDSLAALRHIVYGDPKRLYSFRLTGPALERLSAAAEAFVAAQLERGFRTLEFYKSLQPPEELSK